MIQLVHLSIQCKIKKKKNTLSVCVIVEGQTGRVEITLTLILILTR